MSSKQLHSILSKVPAATIEDEKKYGVQKDRIEETDRIVAVIPRSLKEEIKCYLKDNKGDTERIIILKALKLMGFNVPSDWLIDKRRNR